MREYELEILEQYDIEVTGTRKVRGAFFCDTNEGTMLLKETKMSDRRAPLFYEMLLNLKESGYSNVELPVKNKEGALISTSRDGTRYMVKRWFAGKECDVHKENEILRAVEAMAHLHTKMRWTGDAQESILLTGRHLKDELLCHNREMRKVRSYIRGKSKKSKFEYLYLQYFEKMYQMACQVLGKLDTSGYEKLYGDSIREKRMTHGDYNYHNVLILPGKQEVAVTGFEHFCVDVQMQDLYYFFRKVMEKYHWDERLGNAMLEVYSSIRELEKEELEYIALRVAYPEKFWKTANGYYRSNKAWVSDVNVEKISRSIAETEEKMRMLKNLFSLVL